MSEARTRARTAFAVSLAALAILSVSVGAGVLAAPGDPAVSIEDVRAIEGAGAVEYTLSLSRPSTVDTAVDVMTANGSAVGPGDFQPFGTFSQGRSFVVFPAGDTVVQPTVTITQDGSNEGDESFFIRLSNPIGLELGDAEGVVTIVNDDGAAVPPPQVSIADARGSETAGTLTLWATLSYAPAAEVRVRVSTVEGTAKAGFDYAEMNVEAVTFSAGESKEEIPVVVFNDSIPEGDESFLLRASEPTGSTIWDGEAIATIADDESPSSPTPTTTPTPSPTPTPSVTPTPTPTPTVPAGHQRSISLQLRRHLRARGDVDAGLAPAGCSSAVPVRIQRLVEGRWRVQRHVTTRSDGTFWARMRDTTGTYRAKVPLQVLQDEGLETCLRAVSDPVVHSH